MRTIKIAILGLGNVGGATSQIILNKKNALADFTGKNIEIKYVLVNDINKKRNWDTENIVITDDFQAILNDAEVEIVAEALGGIHPAYEYMKSCLLAGKHVVTANKAALAHGLKELHQIADEKGLSLLYEASVGGAIPGLTAISIPLCANSFTKVRGILNGTCNYILTMMEREGMEFDQVLKLAQEKGFAEADPTADIEGIDVANKLSILTYLALGTYIPPTQISRQGISHIGMTDIEEAKKDGKRLRLIGEAHINEQGSISCNVGVTALEAEDPLYNVCDEFNAIYVEGDLSGPVMFYGKGAGPFPTGSAVAGDIAQIAKLL